MHVSVVIEVAAAVVAVVVTETLVVDYNDLGSASREASDLRSVSVASYVAPGHVA